MSDHRPRCFSEHAATIFHTISRSARLPFLISKNCFRARSTQFAATIDEGKADESVPHTPPPALEPRRSFWRAGQTAFRFHLPQPRDAHAMSIRLQSCRWYPEEKRRACLGGSTRALFAQRSAGSLHRIRRKRGSLFSRNSHKQSSFPFQLDRQRRGSNGNGAFFPTNLEWHSRPYPGFAANVLWNDQPSGVIDGCFHAIQFTIL